MWQRAPRKHIGWHTLVSCRCSPTAPTRRMVSQMGTALVVEPEVK